MSAQSAAPHESYTHETHFTLDSYFSLGLKPDVYRELIPVTKKLILDSLEALNYFRRHPDEKIRGRYSGHVADAFIKNQFIPVLGDSYLLGQRLKEFIKEYHIDEKALKEQADLYFPISELILIPARDYSYKIPLKPRHLPWIERIVSNDAYRRIISGEIRDEYMLDRLKAAADFLTWLTERRGVANPSTYIKLMRQAIANTGLGSITGREKAIQSSKMTDSNSKFETGLDLARFLADTYLGMGITAGTVRAYVDMRDAGHAGSNARPSSDWQSKYYKK